MGKKKATGTIFGMPVHVTQLPEDILGAVVHITEDGKPDGVIIKAIPIREGWQKNKQAHRRPAR